MKRSIILATFALLGLAFLAAPCALTSCSPRPAPHPPASEAGPPPSSAEVCLHLAKVCGVDAAACQRKLDQVHADRLTLLPETCWLRGATPVEVNACGQITCVPSP